MKEDQIKTVPMFRDPAEHGPPHKADVHPAEVDSMRLHGWQPGDGAAAATAVVQGGVSDPAATEGPSAPATVFSDAEMQLASETVAEHRGNGQWSVMHNGAELIEGLLKADAKTFNALDVIGKVNFIAEHCKPAEPAPKTRAELEQALADLKIEWPADATDAALQQLLDDSSGLGEA